MIITQSDRNFYNEHKDEYTHIISIVCPDEKELVKPIHGKHMIVHMWDVDKVLENKFRKYEPPKESIVMSGVYRAVDWYFETLKNKETFNLLVHCDMGVSRSTALSLGILWYISSNIFHLPSNDEENDLLFEIIYARKEWCYNRVDEYSTGLRRYIEGRYNPGVKPNPAILKILRETLMYFPW